MPLLTISTGRTLLAGGTYADKVLGTGPIAYWPLWEASGTVARCLVNPAQNGTYSSNVSTWPPGTGIGDGNTAPGFDGTNDYIDVQTAALAAAFNASQGSFAIWARVTNVGVWTDAATRYIANLQVDANNNVRAMKTNANNQLLRTYVANAVPELGYNNGVATTGWFHLCHTWSVAADEVRYYMNGAWSETDTVLGVWVGALAKSIIGSYNIPVNQPWSGGLAHPAIWSRALAASEIAALAVV